jgi:hypothetical protein
VSAGNPVEARHPIRGLETGDAIAWTIVTAEVVARDNDFAARVRSTMLAARGTSDVLVVAIPRERRDAVYRSMERATA